MEVIYPAAIWMPGPSEKVWPDQNLLLGEICHSMGGTLDSALSILADTSQLNGFYLRPSWHFSIARDGRVYQHYAINRVPFHAGGHYWNSRLIGAEHEGGAPGNDSEPLTPAQLAASIALSHWLREQAQWARLSRDGADKNLFEHREVFGTQCPSGRIPWARYLTPQYNTNIADGFDAGLIRVRDLAIVREATRSFRQAFGSAQDMHAAIADA